MPGIPLAMTPQEVAAWTSGLASLDAATKRSLAKTIADEDVDGATLFFFTTLSESEGLKAMREALGLSVGKATKIWAPLQALVGFRKGVRGEGAAAAHQSEQVEEGIPGTPPTPAELQGLGLRALQRHAVAEGLSELDLDQALDSPRPKDAIVQKLVAARRAATTPSPEAAAEQLLGTLSKLGLRALQKKAEEEGVDDGELDRVMDLSDPKAALVELLVRRMAPVDDNSAARMEALRSELMPLGLRALQKRAEQESLSDSVVDVALDSDSPKDSLLAALVQHIVSSSKAASAAAAAREQKLREELGTLGLRPLQKRAEGAGVDETALDAAVDSDSPKERVIELIVAATAIQAVLTTKGAQPESVPRAQSRPHHGSNHQADAVLDSGTTAEKHAMLSYQWDSQEKVKCVRTLLNAKGQKTWMVRVSMHLPFVLPFACLPPWFRCFALPLKKTGH